ncbi:MAG TPA: competence/damage-inducible protein A [Acidimicrobiales bacterium]|jgi:nicotinamide-nucleotide amidase
MRVEIVAIGTELLLGQIADTNSAWLGEQLAANGLSSHFHQAVGDNQQRIVDALRIALGRSDAVIVCGGLGPTHDDITRDAIAELMGVPLVRDEAVVARIASFFAQRGRTMSANNARQADVPVGASLIEPVGTAPGLVCPVGSQVVYAVPGVPSEMAAMFTSGILPDLQARMTAAGEQGVIVSRVIRTWGASESGLAEALEGRIEELDARLAASEGETVTVAFLASGIEGIKCRLTARAATRERAVALLDAEEAEARAVIAERLGDIVFGLDDQNMERVVADLLIERGLSLGLAESLTGGMIASRLVDVEGASAWFRGSVVSYATDVKRTVLGVGDGPVVSERAAAEMATAARRLLGADVGLAITGVAGPTEQDGRSPGTVFVGLALPDAPAVARELRVPGARNQVRSFAVISALDLLRRALLAGSVVGS